MTLQWNLCICFAVLHMHVRFLVASGDTNTDPEDYSLRLRDGDADYEGRLEIYYNKQWGTICGLGWTNHEGNVACKQLGFYGVFSVQDARHFGEGTGPIMLKDVMCASESITKLSDCNKSEWYVDDTTDCDPKEVVGLRCLVNPPPDSLHEIRLVGGNSIMEGRIEIHYNGNWGTVCGDGWDFRDATVVCRQLKFGPPKTEKYFFGAGSGPVVISFASCFGYETRFLECPVQSSNRKPECTHDNDVGIICNAPSDPFPLALLGASSPYRGRVSLYYHGRQGTICSDQLDIQIARVVCRQLGYGLARHAQVAKQYYGEGRHSDAIHLSGVRCNGDELYLAACSHTKFGDNSCTHTMDAGMECEEPSIPDYKLRIIGGLSNYKGRLQVYFQGQWKNMCNNPIWGMTAANVACRQMKVGLAISAGADTSPVSYSAFNSHFNCLGNENKLIECNHGEVQLTDCGTMGVATLQCRPYEMKSFERAENSLRLVAGSVPYEGRVEWYHNFTWSTVCSNQWDIRDAMVVCRQLGYGVALEATTVFNKGRKAPKLVDNMACIGNEEVLIDCKHGQWGTCNKFTFYGDAGVICNSFGHQGYFEKSAQSIEAHYPLRLVGGPTPNEGRLEILLGDTWGTIAEKNLRNWNLTATQVACNELGYNEAVDWKYTISAPDSTNISPIHLTDVDCLGNEGTISVCSHSQWGKTDQMRHGQDIYLVCSQLYRAIVTGPLTPASQPTNKQQTDSDNTPADPRKDMPTGNHMISTGIIVLIAVCILSVIGGTVIGVVLYNRKRIRQRFPNLYPGTGAVRL